MDATNVVDNSFISKFWAKVDKDDSDCWQWKGSIAKSGYGQFAYKNSTFRKSWYAHRLAYELANGPIPPGMVICHQCDNPCCVNPDHLFLGTYSDNTQDMLKKGRNKGFCFNGRTHCKNGHELVAENIGFDKSNNCNVCLTCLRQNAKLRQQAYRLRKRLANQPFMVPLPLGQHVCIDCGQLSITEQWRKSRCKTCQNAHDRTYRMNNREQTNANSRVYKARKRAEKRQLV